MKSRSQELLDKSTAAMLAALEVYNKPSFAYRAESFAILATNAWELLLKAYWLQVNNSKARSLYVREKSFKKDGTAYKQPRIKLSRSGNPMTHSVDFLAKKLVESGEFEQVAWQNIQVLLEFRDTAVHFFNRSGIVSQQLQSIGAAAVRNYCYYAQTWFEEDLSRYDVFLMPFAFVDPADTIDAVVMTKEEGKLAAFIGKLEATSIPPSSCQFAIQVRMDFVKTKSTDAIHTQLSNDPNAPKVQLSDDQVRQRYPLTYDDLCERCKKRYADFKTDKKYHDIRKPLQTNQKFCMIRLLDPNNPSGTKKPLYSDAIFTELDKHYARATTSAQKPVIPSSSSAPEDSTANTSAPHPAGDSAAASGRQGAVSDGAQQSAQPGGAPVPPI